jgi:glycosyltransferase involved in cell wall biosynthesis
MSKNVLFIGPYRQNDGWGEAAKQYIYALIRSGCNLTIRPIYMGTSVGELPVELLEYEENKLPHYDVVIQNVLPHLLDYNSDFGKNIALIYTETGNWQNAWPSRLNKMDSIWVPSGADARNIQSCGVMHPQVFCMPIPVNVNKFNKSYESTELAELKDTGNFTFYFVGEFIQRKGIEKLIQAFHIEFEHDEPVSLLIKTNKSGADPNALATVLNNQSNKIKAILRLYNPKNLDKYKKEMFITNRLSDNDILALHQYCDCLVMPSSGESWSMPVADALGFGNTPIVVEKTGPCEMVNPDNGYWIPSKDEYVFVLDPPLPDMYTGRETWRSFTIYDLCKTMRRAYEERNNPTLRDQGKEDIYEFSYDKVAKLMAETL